MATTNPQLTASSARVRFNIRSLQRRHIVPTIFVTLLGLAVMLLFLLPLGYMIATAFKSEGQLSSQNAPLWPAKITTYNYQGQELPLYNVPTSEGIKQWALVKGFREDANFIDPQHLDKGVFDWVGRYRVFDPVYEFSP